MNTPSSEKEARKAAKDAQRMLCSAQKKLANVEMGRDDRHKATDRLKNLEQVLTTIEAKDPGVFARRPSTGRVQQDDLFPTTPRGAGDRKNGDGS